MMLVILFAVLLGLVGLGVPVLLGIGGVGLAGVLLSPELNPAFFAQKAFTILDSFALLAMPYFILAGSLMARGGLAEKLVEFAEVLVGHVRGSLGHTAVISCVGMANVSGSSAAEAAAIGSIVIPEMKKRGYKPGFAAALVGTAATIGPIIPPSMTMIVYGSMTGVSIGGLFLSGILPGILIGALLMGVTYGFSFLPRFAELRQTSQRAGWGEVRRGVANVWVAILAPVIILGGILAGVFTATEAGVVACLYALFVGFFVYRSLKLRDLPEILLESAVTTAMVVGIISMAGVLGWLLSYLDFNDVVLGTIQSVTDDPIVVAFILLGVMFVMCMFLESLAVLIILVPVATFVSSQFGFDPFHIGLLMVLSTQIGATTPPVAVLLFVTTSVAKCSFGETCRYCAPFILVLVISLLTILFVPGLATWLPHAMLG